MKPAKHILVALSLTELSLPKFQFAVDLAKSLEAKLFAANIINSRDVDAVGRIASMGFEIDSDHYIQSVMNERRREFKEIAKASSVTEDSVQLLLRVGNPAEELLRIIEAEDIDMVVMGPRGRTDLEHLIMGSVAEKIFRRSPVTVVSFRDERHRKRIEQTVS